MNAKLEEIGTLVPGCGINNPTQEALIIDRVEITSDIIDTTIDILILDILDILTAVFPPGESGSPYSHTAVAKNGVQPYSWAIIDAIPYWPEGLNLDEDTGTISGIPIGTGSYTCTIYLVDYFRGVDTELITISVEPGP